MSGPVDEGVPNVARMYDYFLGGSHNFASNRERAERILAARPSMISTARANRNFLKDAVERLLDLGIRQFLDLGSGIPTVGNVHEVIHRRGHPEARVAYVDIEPVAVAHSEAILADVPTATITGADYRDPDAVLASPGVRELLDFSRPVGLLAVTALHFVTDAEDPAGLLRRYRGVLGAGSVLALTHGSDDYPEHPDFAREQRAAIELYGSTDSPIRLRSRAAISEMVTAAGFVPAADGLVEVSHWAVPPQDTPLGLYTLVSEPLS